MDMSRNDFASRPAGPLPGRPVRMRWHEFLTWFALLAAVAMALGAALGFVI